MTMKGDIMSGSWLDELARRARGETSSHVGQNESLEHFNERTGRTAAAALSDPELRSQFEDFQAWRASQPHAAPDAPQGPEGAPAPAPAPDPAAVENGAL